MRLVDVLLRAKRRRERVGDEGKHKRAYNRHHHLHDRAHKPGDEWHFVSDAKARDAKHRHADETAKRSQRRKRQQIAGIELARVRGLGGDAIELRAGRQQNVLSPVDETIRCN